MRRAFSFFFLLLIASTPLRAGETVDLDAVTKIREQGFRHSKVMELAWHLTEGIGPRLTGSPAELAAHEWAQKTFEEWGIPAVIEDYDFGRSWVAERAQVRLLEPYMQPLEALPEAWSPGTNGPVSGRVVRAKLDAKEDLEEWAGKLQGTIVLLDDLRDPEQIDADLFDRYDGEEIQDIEEYEIPGDRQGEWREKFLKRYQFWLKKAAFLEEQGVVATIEVSSRDNGIVRVTGSSSNRSADRPLGVPALTMVTEQYNRLMRFLDDGVEPVLEIDVAVHWDEDDLQAYNTIAEIGGSDLADQIIVMGAHLDSWHTGTGATDNGGNSAVVMEAMRILKASGLAPRRTIRAALWSGEEQGFLGSKDYVQRRIATRPETTDPDQLALPIWAREATWPITVLPEHAATSAYFNIDYGAGRIRGLYAQENAAVVPIFDAWLAPFADLGADHVTMENASGTDHMSFDRVGVPAFQFIQDPMDYMGRTHHTNVDTYDHLDPEDLKQSAVILAAVVWQAANRDQPLPRKPMPEKPADREE